MRWDCYCGPVLAETLVGALFRCVAPACCSVHDGPALGPEPPLVAAWSAWSLLQGLLGLKLIRMLADALPPPLWRRRPHSAGRPPGSWQRGMAASGYLCRVDACGGGGVALTDINNSESIACPLQNHTFTTPREFRRPTKMALD